MSKYLLIVAALFLVFGLGVIFGGESPDTAIKDFKDAKEPHVGVFDRVETKEIVIRDSKDRRRARITVDASDTLRFTGSSNGERDALVLSVFEDGRAALILRDDRGRNRVALSIREDGRPVVTLSENANIILHDERGRNRVVLSQMKGGDPHLSLYDDKSRETVVSPLVRLSQFLR